MIRDFSDMSADQLRAFSAALDEIGRRAQEKEMKKRRKPDAGDRG